MRSNVSSLFLYPLMARETPAARGAVALLDRHHFGFYLATWIKNQKLESANPKTCKVGSPKTDSASRPNARAENRPTLPAPAEGCASLNLNPARATFYSTSGGRAPGSRTGVARVRGLKGVASGIDLALPDPRPRLVSLL
ncbi:MAG TPA: hypothetical protein VF064_02410 [Pyrinomonadaceae bacterium]